LTQGRSSQTFLADPASPREARRFVTGWLRDNDLEDQVDRVKLAVSELAANAMLHTGQPFTVTIDNASALIAIEVVDSEPNRVPMRVPLKGSAVDITSMSATGRGLQILSALANRWGVRYEHNVKATWAEFDALTPDRPSDPIFDDQRGAPPQPDDDVLRLRFIGLPVRAAIASGLDVEAAIRDVQLPTAGVDAAFTRELLALADRSASLRLPGRHAAMHAAAQNQFRFDFEADATRDALSALAELNSALAQVPHPSGVGPSSEVVAFRAWLGEETRRQARGEPPLPYETESPRADNAGAWLWEQASCGYATITPAGQLRTTNTTLRRWLDLDDEAPILFTALLSDDSRRIFTEDLVPALLAGNHCDNVELDFDRPDGSRLHAHVSALIDGELIRAVIAGPDESAERADQLIRALQQTLVPAALPTVPGLDVAAAYHPAEGEVGGDFYDVFEVADGDWCVVLGDVSGKGIEAGIVTSDARHAVRSSALREPEPSGLMRALNSALVDKGGSNFCTVALLRLQLTGGSWVATLTSGGHPYPLLIRHGTATKLGKAGSLLGVFHEVNFHDVSIKLAAGDALVLYTDGVTEARNAAGEFFGEERMHATLTGGGHSAQFMVDSLLKQVLDFQTGPADDIAIVVIRRPGL
jgi:sigma-B regulation protein RsbU (phosphoserine phosphatase)